MYLESILRHALTGLGGVLITVGVNNEAATGLVNALVPVIGGVLSYALGQILSIADKKKR